MRFWNPMATARDQGEAEQDLAVESAPGKDPAQWIAGLLRHGDERLARLGGAAVAGVVVAFVALYAFAVLADQVLEQQTAALDNSTLELMRRFASPQLTRAAEIISLFGSELVWVVGLILLGVFAWQRRWGAALMLTLVAGGAQLLNDVLKEVFHRARPESVQAIINAQQFSFPSGHAMVSAAFYLYLAYLTWRLVRGWWRAVLIFGLVVLVLLIGLSRIYLEAHYLSDVIAGYLVGVLWTDALILGSHGLKRRTQRRLRQRTLAG
jgi:membrane-associated phospholipid phosphatase